MMNTRSNRDSRWEMLLFDYVEGNLSPEEAAEVERMMMESPAIRAEVEAWRNAKASSPPPIVYPYKDQLKKSAPSAVALWWTRWGRIAAVFFVGITLGLLIAYLIQWAGPTGSAPPITAHSTPTHPISTPSRPPASSPTAPIASPAPTPSPSLPSPQVAPSSPSPVAESTPSSPQKLDNPSSLPLLSSLPSRTIAWAPSTPLPTPNSTIPLPSLPEPTSHPTFRLFQRIKTPIAQLVIAKRSSRRFEHYRADIQVGNRRASIEATALKPKYWLPYTLGKINQLVIAQLTEHDTNQN